MFWILRQVATQTTTVMQAQVTVFLAVYSRNQSDQDLAMSTKQEGPFRPVLTTGPQPEENAKRGTFLQGGGEKFLGKVGANYFHLVNDPDAFAKKNSMSLRSIAAVRCASR